ncbi:hypothetical protein FA95DRAFT_1567231 [Auriscalpium vulgare]|uniref:Uncharacterized protein n=1 Tax=Auriscalpium vulgare TaxID=40419 RepID=A0ACB8R5Y1_9AGAM|nr:hypothetical protein FA95DRAFT_1567231 [Auriscalpium vulgare]
MHLDSDADGLLALCSPAPLLHTLKLFFHAYNHVLQSGLPMLRHLSVSSHNVCIWAPLLLPHLVSLEVSLFAQPTPRPVLNAMFDALGAMRALERLELRLCPQSTEGAPVTLLPALQHLRLRSTVAEARAILARVALPADVHVHCDMYSATDLAAELRALLLAAAACVDARAAPISHVEVRQAAAHLHCQEPRPYVEVNAWRGGDGNGAPALVLQFAHKGDMVWDYVPCDPDNLGVLPALCALVIHVQAHPLASSILTGALPRCLAARARAGNVLQELQVVGYSEDESCVRALQEAVPGLLVRW